MVQSPGRRCSGAGCRRPGQEGKRRCAPQREWSRPGKSRSKMEGGGKARRYLTLSPLLVPLFLLNLPSCLSGGAFGSDLALTPVPVLRRPWRGPTRARLYPGGWHPVFVSGPSLRLGNVTPVYDPLLSHPHASHSPSHLAVARGRAVPGIKFNPLLWGRWGNPRSGEGGGIAQVTSGRHLQSHLGTQSSELLHPLAMHSPPPPPPSCPKLLPPPLPRFLPPSLPPAFRRLAGSSLHPSVCVHL